MESGKINIIGLDLSKIQKPKPRFHNDALKRALEAVHISRDSIAWFEFEHGRKFAPWPKNKLRLAARKAGFKSSAQFLANEHRASH